jgi:hypothetical protein
LEIVAPGVGLAVAVEKDEALDRAYGIAAEATVFEFDGGALAQREGF